MHVSFANASVIDGMVMFCVIIFQSIGCLSEVRFQSRLFVRIELCGRSWFNPWMWGILRFLWLGMTKLVQGLDGIAGDGEVANSVLIFPG